jgi:peptide/nickel transport system permease protein
MASSDSSPALPKKSWLRLLKPKGQGANISVVFMLLGILITGAFIAIALLTPALQSWGILQDPTAALTNPIHEPPGAEHLLGTTRQGYDVLSRVLFGTRAAWQVVLLATAMSVVVGVPLGMVSGYLGGRLDRGLLFFMDTIYTLPGLLLSVTLAFVVGRGVVNAAVALSIAYVPQYYRVVRNHTVSVLFIEAAQAILRGMCSAAISFSTWCKASPSFSPSTPPMPF